MKQLRTNDYEKVLWLVFPMLAVKNYRLLGKDSVTEPRLFIFGFWSFLPKAVVFIKLRVFRSKVSLMYYRYTGSYFNGIRMKTKWRLNKIRKFICKK